MLLKRNKLLFGHATSILLRKSSPVICNERTKTRARCVVGRFSFLVIVD